MCTEIKNVIFNKVGGNASRNAYACKVSLPKEWIYSSGITTESKKVNMEYNDRSLVLKKEIDLPNELKLFREIIDKLSLIENMELKCVVNLDNEGGLINYKVFGMENIGSTLNTSAPALSYFTALDNDELQSRKSFFFSSVAESEKEDGENNDDVELNMTDCKLEEEWTMHLLELIKTRILKHFNAYNIDNGFYGVRDSNGKVIAQEKNTIQVVNSQNQLITKIIK